MRGHHAFGACRDATSEGNQFNLFQPFKRVWNGGQGQVGVYRRIAVTGEMFQR